MCLAAIYTILFDVILAETHRQVKGCTGLVCFLVECAKKKSSNIGNVGTITTCFPIHVIFIVQGHLYLYVLLLSLKVVIYYTVFFFQVISYSHFHTMTANYSQLLTYLFFLVCMYKVFDTYRSKYCV